MSVSKSPGQKAMEGHPNKALLLPAPKPKGEPRKPKALSDDASKFWDHYIPKLIALGLATEIDEAALIQLTFWWDVWQQTAKKLQDADYGTIETTRTMNINSKAFDSFRRLAQHFGMTPLARNNLTVIEVDEKEDSFFKK